MSGRYLLYLPRDYDRDDRRWPLVLFLHGAGERGDDVAKVASHGPPKLVAEGRDFPFILVSPQCPADRVWSMAFLDALLDEVSRDYRVDLDRIYVTGLSMGGFATWSLAMEFPTRFAAIAPLCGGGAFYNACAIRDVPAWVFHGALDNVISPDRSREMVEALRSCGAQPKFTLYPDLDHDVWTKTYDDPALYDWLLSQRRSRPSTPPL
jgi:predicted peptidase